MNCHAANFFFCFGWIVFFYNLEWFFLIKLQIWQNSFLYIYIYCVLTRITLIFHCHTRLLCYLQISPVVTLLHQHLFLMLPVARNILSKVEQLISSKTLSPLLLTTVEGTYAYVDGYGTVMISDSPLIRPYLKLLDKQQCFL